MVAGLAGLLNRPGAVLALFLVFLLGLMGTTRLSLVGLLSLLGRLARRAWWSLTSRRTPEIPAMDPPVEAPEVRQTLIARPTVKIEAPPPPPAPPEPETPPAPAAKPRRASAAAGKFTLPSLDLLDAPKPWDHQVQEGQMMAQAEKLEATLRHFGVEGKVTAIIPGPVVSRFELEPAPGVKISRVTNLSDDLALALKALSIRIVAPVPGRPSSGSRSPIPSARWWPSRKSWPTPDTKRAPPP